MKKNPLDLVEEDVSLARLCTDVTVYWRGSVFERAEGVLHFYNRALKLIRGKVRQYETETMGGVAPIKKDTFDLLPFWLSKPKARRGIYALLLESAEQGYDSSDQAFVFFYDQEMDPPMGVMRLVLPVTMMEESPDDFVSLVSDLTKELDFESGSAGYSINWEPRGDNAGLVEEFLYKTSKRYIGVDIPQINTTLVNLQESDAPALKRINWITLLGSDLGGRLGSMEKARAALPKGCEVLDLGGGKRLIRAGARPSLGELRKKEKLPAYAAVGHLLSPYRVQNHAPLFLDDDDATETWLARFDG